MLRELSYSIRALARQRAFTLTATLVLGLAISVNTAVFSIVNSLLYRPLPVRSPQELGFVADTDDRVAGIPDRDYLALQSMSGLFSGVAAFGGDAAQISTAAGLLTVQGEAVSPNYFDVLGVQPRLGRAFTSDRERENTADPVVIIAESLWKSQFGGDPDVIGRPLRISLASPYAGRYAGWRDYTIIGVMPASFGGTGNPWQPADYWVLIDQRRADFRAFYQSMAGRPSSRDFGVWPVARLAPGVTFAQARAALRAESIELLRQRSTRVPPDERYDLLSRPRVSLPFSGAYLFSAPRIALGLIAVTLLLLVIAASNLAGLLMARGVGRTQEMAIRASLGARPFRLLRQSFMESVLLAAVGGVAGVLGSRLLIALLLHEIPRQVSAGAWSAVVPTAPIDWHVLLFAIATCFITAIVMGIGPSVAAARVNLLSLLNAGETSVTGAGRSRLRRFVLVPQIALALVLLTVAGVLVRSLLRLEWAPPGYDASHVVIADVQLPYRPVQSAADRAAAAAEAAGSFARVLASVRALPDVAAAAATFDMPRSSGLPAGHTTIVARAEDGARGRYTGATIGFISSDYFAVFGIPLLHGRTFDARDAAAPDRTVIVSERLARDLWPGRDPIGDWVALSSPDSQTPPRWRAVVGVAGSVTLPSEEDPRPTFYVPIESSPQLASGLVVRGSGNVSQLMAHVRDAVSRGDRTALVSSMRTMDEAVDAVRYPRRVTASLLGSAGAASLLIAVIGVLGLVSYAVARRTREIGVRMVLGATPADVVRLVLVDTGRVIALGIAIGCAGAVAALRYASHALVPLPRLDALTVVAVAGVLIMAVLIACLVPASRAATVDPSSALRHI